MATATFDRLTRRLGQAGTRRTILGALIGAASIGYTTGAAPARSTRRRRASRPRAGTRKRLAVQSKPGREVIDLTDDFVIDTCGFPVHVHQEGKVIALDFGDRLLFAVPGATWELTNPESGASRRVVIPGPEFVELHEDGTVTVRGAGPWVWGRRHPETREPGIWLTIGRFVWVFDADGTLISAEFNGKSENLCEALA
jgi:hypothetical protein